MNLSLVPRGLAAIALLAIASPARAQEPRQPPSPILLKRLAEALDGHRTGTPVFIVACRDSLNRIGGVVATRREAESLARRLGPCFDTYGPYLALLDLLSQRGNPGCVHDGYTSNMIGLICPDNPFLLADVVSMTLVVRMRDGTVRERRMGPEVDAIFLTLPAIDKFVIPYYARIVGVDSAAAMRGQLARSFSIR